MPNEESSVSITIRKGLENSLVIQDMTSVFSNASKDDTDFLKPSYEKAVAAVKSYLDRADKVFEQYKNAESITKKNNILYQSPSNIIAFTGEKGTGKTSAMLSFSNALNSKETIESIGLKSDRKFLVLNPIDPTMLEDNQNILNAVLSRMMNKAQELWNSSSQYDERRISYEEMRNDLVNKFRSCLDEISAMKSSRSIENLDQLQKYGDSAILKDDLTTLVRYLIDFSERNCSFDKKNNILVILIDDTDCQITKGYEVMEDIRRYLTLPNVLILMACDISALHNIILQEYERQFSQFLSINENLHKSLSDIENYSSAYLVKLLPPTNKIYLPDFDTLLKENTHQLDIHYVEEVSKGYNELKKFDYLELDNGQKSFEAKILTYLYKRTYLFFSERIDHCNEILPQTLRGMSQMLHFLSTLQEIPEPSADQLKNLETIEKYIKNNQLPILEKNIDSFEAYFLNEWAVNKLNPDFRDIIVEITKQDSADRITFIYKKLKDYYYFDMNVNTPTYYELDQRLQSISGEITYDNLTPDNNYNNVISSTENKLNVFAVRTTLDILNFKDLIIFTRNSNNSKISPNDYLIRKGSFPNLFYLNKEELPFYSEYQNNELSTEIFMNPLMGISYAFQSGFNSTLSLKSDPRLDSITNYCQKRLAYIIACNYDAKLLIRKTVRKINEETNSEKGMDLNRAIEFIYKEIVSEFNKVNLGMLSNITRVIINDNYNIMRWRTAARQMRNLISHENAGSFKNNEYIITIVNMLPDKYPENKDEREIVRDELDLITGYLKQEEDKTATDIANRISKFLTEHRADIDYARHEYRDLYRDINNYFAKG